MDKNEFEKFLYQQIPITKAMELNVINFTASKVKISAKLEPNINHKSTAFGGSINSLMAITGWSLVFANIKDIDPNAHIVISNSNIKYLKPIEKDFTAECTLTNEGDRVKLFKMYNKHHKSSITMKVYCYDNGVLLAEFEGQYVIFSDV